MTHLHPRRRAVHVEQKEERRQAILDTAWLLFQSTSYEGVTIAGVAETLGLAKGTVYLYFKTKEELFLAVLEQQMVAWFAEADAVLSELDHPSTIPRVTNLLCSALERRPGLTRLLAILHTLLEQNIELESARQFKYMLRDHFNRTGALMEQCLPFLPPGEGARLLFLCEALIIGLWQLADPAPIIQQVLQEPDFQLFAVQFAAEFSALLQALRSGSSARSSV